MARALQYHGNRMTIAWQYYGKRMVIAWQTTWQLGLLLLPCYCHAIAIKRRYNNSFDMHPSAHEVQLATPAPK
eukprot:3016456-Heterocapsa_arctica.AAC.1